MKRYGRWSDERLLAATRAGDAEAFGIFFARHSVGVLAFVRRRTANAEDAADLTAETFAAALLSVHRGRAQDVVEGGPWLTGIARNKLVDSYRSGQLRDIATRKLGLTRAPLDPDDTADIDAAGGADQQLGVAIESLSPEERHAILQRIVLERDYAQIAADAQLSEPVIRKRVSRGLTRLRDTMGAKT
jgi:RNA polymerase sigma factor (sigma-70 family)